MNVSESVAYSDIFFNVQYYNNFFFFFTVFLFQYARVIPSPKILQ